MDPAQGRNPRTGKENRVYAVYALEACGSFVGFQSAESVPDKSGACWGDRGRRYSVKHCVADVRKPSPPATTPYQAPSCFFKEHAAPWKAPSEFYSGGEVHTVCYKYTIRFTTTEHTRGAGRLRGVD